MEIYLLAIIPAGILWGTQPTKGGWHRWFWNILKRQGFTAENSSNKNKVIITNGCWNYAVKRNKWVCTSDQCESFISTTFLKHVVLFHFPTGSTTFFEQCSFEHHNPRKLVLQNQLTTHNIYHRPGTVLPSSHTSKKKTERTDTPLLQGESP